MQKRQGSAVTRTSWRTWTGSQRQVCEGKEKTPQEEHAVDKENRASGLHQFHGATISAVWLGQRCRNFTVDDRCQKQLENAIRKTPNGKATGPDRMLAELLKIGVEGMAKWLMS